MCCSSPAARPSCIDTAEPRLSTIIWKCAAPPEILLRDCSWAMMCWRIISSSVIISPVNVSLSPAYLDGSQYDSRFVNVAGDTMNGNLTINRFFALDGRAYEAGALGVKTKEMLGLVSSMVLRCDDCITYHVVRCHEEGTTREEFLEIFSVGLIVGGSIVIPHLRRAMARLEELEAAKAG